MKLIEYLRTLSVDERAAFARRCKTTPNHLRNVSYDQKTCGEDLAMAIERESGGQVTVEEMRPDLADLWAYMRGTAAARQEVI